MESLIKAINEAKEQSRFEKKLNKVTNKHNYKKHVKKVMHRMDNPMTQEEIDAIIYKQQNSFSAKRKKRIQEIKVLCKRVVLTTRVWIYYFKNKGFFDGLVYQDVCGVTHKRFPFPTNMENYEKLLSKSYMMYNITNALKKYKNI